MDGNGTLVAPTDEAVWSAVRAAPMESKPGTQFSDNQLNYALPGKVIENRSGVPFTRFVTERQLEPAGIYSTAEEMASWIIALQSGRLLKRASLATLWEPGLLKDGDLAGVGGALNGYALGWVVMSREPHRAAGGIGGGRAAFFLCPEDDVAVVILTNLRGASPQAFVDEVAAGWMGAGAKRSGGGR